MDRDSLLYNSTGQLIKDWDQVFKLMFPEEEIPWGMLIYNPKYDVQLKLMGLALGNI